MSKAKVENFDWYVLILPLYIVVLLWIIFWFTNTGSFEFQEFGILPRTIEGLIGIVTSAFLHGSAKHIVNNTLALFFLLACLRYFYRNIFYSVLFYSLFFSGLGTWLIGRSSYHIGASGVIYALVGFIFFKGFRTRNYRLMALSFIIVLFYGGLIWYMFPDVEDSISWEGHLSGFLTGMVLAFMSKTAFHEQKKKYEWEQPGFVSEKDPFMRHFDQQGRFIAQPTQTNTNDITHKIVYEIKTQTKDQ